ncbi:MAG: ribosome biogenesis GTPase YlqF [Erysipelotrichaceae bacterium]|jgi:ribosome biogenesis GTPase A|nr:ribosome biogenesis GTPase YlqF [Erysipelotrichaceae bacterium]
MSENNIHWFPGHMKKALNEIEERLKIIDVVVELVDARAPKSSMNFSLENRIKNKPHLFLITKADLADPKENQKWVKYFSSGENKAIIGDLKSRDIINKIKSSLIPLASKKREKEARRGMKPQPIKTMIIGIPNVGKSTLINKIAERKSAGVENKPGLTRAEQWIKVDKDFILLDTPGILPMNYESQIDAANLALIGSIREDILPYEILVNYLLKIFREHYPRALESRFAIFPILDDESVTVQIANNRGLISNGQIDLLRAQKLLVKEFKDGLLGHISLERI